MGSDRLRTKSITLSDVARDAGVSPMTVSRVINGETSVKAATRIAVKESIKKLNYRPNVGARRLAGAKIARVCLLYGNPSSSYLGELLLGVIEGVSQLGHQLVIKKAQEGFVPEELIEQYGSHWDGVIIPTPYGDDPEVRKAVESAQIPTVYIAGDIKGNRSKVSHAFELGIDNKDAARTLTNYLIAQGHRHIGFIKGNRMHGGSELRYQGFCEAMEKADLEINPLLVEQGDFTYKSGMEAATRMLSFDPAPTAIFAANDDMAAGVLGAGARHGLIMPDDLSVVGFDDSPLAVSVWPPLTTIHQPVSELGCEAVEVLEQLINAKATGDIQMHVRHKWLDYTLIKRQSSVPPKQA